MKKFVIVLAFLGLIAGCQHRDNRAAGAPGTETGTYEGDGSSWGGSSTNDIIIPQNPNY